MGDRRGIESVLLLDQRTDVPPGRNAVPTFPEPRDQWPEERDIGVEPVLAQNGLAVPLLFFRFVCLHHVTGSFLLRAHCGRVDCLPVRILSRVWSWQAPGSCAELLESTRDLTVWLP